MACGATLKRSLEFDPLHSPSQSTPIKRRRCMPLTMVQTTPPTKNHQLSQSPFGEVQLTKEEIAARIGSELKRIQRRKQLVYPSAHSSPLTTCAALGRQSPPVNSELLASVASASTGDFPASSLPSTSSSGLNSPKQKDVPLFTFKQVAMICERMVRDHEDKIKEQYDKVLNNKLSEQYEAFLKFNHDQLQKRFGNAPMSYVS
ncbi:akirin 2 [Elysia marginata]|uniref:Akirin 2 n=1 Tax=Elysia marginata TaxID=1093978 RepID=A0AAV4GQ42_9GAST|nr:akirin 2 [Elysia marginata]